MRVVPSPPLRTKHKHLRCMRKYSRRVAPSLLLDVVSEIQLQDDAFSLEFLGKRREGVGGANSGHSRLIQGIRARLKGECHLADIAGLHDGEEQPHLAAAP